MMPSTETFFALSLPQQRTISAALNRDIVRRTVSQPAAGEEEEARELEVSRLLLAEKRKRKRERERELSFSSFFSSEPRPGKVVLLKKLSRKKLDELDIRLSSQAGLVSVSLCFFAHNFHSTLPRMSILTDAEVSAKAERKAARKAAKRAALAFCDAGGG